MDKAIYLPGQIVTCRNVAPLFIGFYCASSRNLQSPRPPAPRWQTSREHQPSDANRNIKIQTPVPRLFIESLLFVRATFAYDHMEEEDDERTVAPAHYLEDHRYDPGVLAEAQDWSSQEQQDLQKALATLDYRSQDILRKRWLAEQKATLHELAAKYQISAERIRQLEQIALATLKTRLVQSA